ncbi:DUF72 domain-containing protein [Flavihumibacter sp. CACIAM 22H1]|uniref:DUF72 domain-containing protein n=1 Tax=Flavihumibacter sp. CACIAM 22H1 TaxID=1812911 RepID=UPI0007A878EF|nr:DUF72 domain-containing protein [Flavihumibacter sp. CACIAM 22H1]KYP13164.1 MAG: hypothetical protein A1D16_07175 [Flavihumibacter sp. CACIAM 22H1]
MEFGKVALGNLNQVDFSLVPDPPLTSKVLAGSRDRDAAFFLGAARWTVPEWVGTLYPRTAKAVNFLAAYARQFNAVELNATHYKIYTEEELLKWVNQVDSIAESVNHPGEFVFCPKLFQGISHRGALKGKEDQVKAFVDSVKVFDKGRRTRLGPVFIQLSDQFSPTRQVELLEFLASLPSGIQWMVELRHAAWFEQTQRMDDFYRTLSDLKIGLVITDVAGRRDVCSMLVTIPQVFIRFVGNQGHSSDFSRIDAWAIRLQQWFESGLKTAFFWLHLGQDSMVPAVGAYAGKKIALQTGLKTAVPVLEEDAVQGKLF